MLYLSINLNPVLILLFLDTLVNSVNNFYIIDEYCHTKHYFCDKSTFKRIKSIGLEIYVFADTTVFLKILFLKKKKNEAGI